MEKILTHVKMAPKGMGLNDFVAQKEGYFEAEGLDIEFDWKTFKGTQSSWKNFKYFERPQDKPYADGEQVIQCACLWGTISNASAGAACGHSPLGSKSAKRTGSWCYSDSCVKHLGAKPCGAAKSTSAGKQ